MISITEQKLLQKKKEYTSNKDKLQLANTCNELAEYYLRKGSLEKAKNEFKFEAKLYKDLGKPILFAQANRMIGEVCTSLAEFDEALKYEQIHLDIAEEHNNALEKQRALASIGRIYLVKASSDPEKIDTDSLDLAYDSFLKSLATCDRIKNIKTSELLDMKARLYVNIGVVKEHSQNFAVSQTYMKKSIELCKKGELYDQLHHTYYSLGLLLVKTKSYKDAITNFNYALEVASRLSDKIPALCATYLAKAEVLIQLKEFSSAKEVLISAYKLKSPNISEQEIIENNLKIVAAICKAEDTLIVTPITDYKKRKQLYEKMGDASINLKCFEHAINYYEQMLECAVAAGEKGSALLPVYISLAQTYRDNKQYKMAFEYFQKEFEICKTNPEESYQSLLNIADILSLLEQPFQTIADTYMQARQEAEKIKNNKVERKVLTYFVNFLKKSNKSYTALEEELNHLGGYETDSDSEAETPDIGEEMSIDEIIGDTTEESNNKTVQKRQKRIRQKKITTNIKGETPLHQACIKGELLVVQNLVEGNHPINVRDNCGWLPIHEACNHGRTEIVKYLISKGAFVNDRGGIKCEGVTPLHDACSNGCLEVIEILLQNGASPIAITDDGNTPLDFLTEWRNRQVSLSPQMQLFYNSICNKLKVSLEKVGRSTNKSPLKLAQTTYDSDEEPCCSRTVTSPKLAQTQTYDSDGETVKSFEYRRSTHNSPLKVAQTETPDLRYNIDIEQSCSKTVKRKSFDARNEYKRSSHKSPLKVAQTETPDLRYNIDIEQSCSKTVKRRSSDICNEYKRSSYKSPLKVSQTETPDLRYSIDIEQSCSKTVKRKSSDVCNEYKRSSYNSPLKMAQTESPDLRYSIDIERSCSKTVKRKSFDVCNEYQRAIDGLKARPTERKYRVTKKSALLSDSDNNDDDNWLEDDLGKQPKKRNKHNIRKITPRSSEEETDACNEYKRAMEGLKPQYTTTKKSVLQSDSDDWSDDSTANKKRKRQSTTNSNISIESSDSELENTEPNTANKKHKTSQSVNDLGINQPKITNKHNIPRYSSSDDSSDNKKIKPWSTRIRRTNSNSNSEQENSEPNTANNKKHRPSQSSLLDSGFVRTQNESPTNVFNAVTQVDKTTNKPYKRQQKLHSFVSNAQLTITDDSYTPVVLARPPMLAVSVKIENKLFRIPIVANEMNNLTIGWLATEAGKRYYKQEGIAPTLQLLTKDGAILISEDPLSMVFISETQAEEIHSDIVSWNLPALPRRYMEACYSMKIDPCPVLKKSLHDCEGTRFLKLTNLNRIQFPAFFRALNRQNYLQNLELTDIKLFDDGVKQFCCVLPSLIQLRSLNLSGNNITEEGVRFLSEVFTRTGALPNLDDLNLSFNNFFIDDMLQYLATITQKLKLRVLNLCGCSLPPKIFSNDYNQHVELNFKYLEHFDISLNDLNTSDVIKIMSYLNFNIISNLNVSKNTNVKEDGITGAIVDKLRQCDTYNLKNLNLSMCHVIDNEIWDLLRVLTKPQELGSLDLSHNEDLTAVSLRRLIQHRPSFSSLTLLGCRNILKYFNSFSFTSDPSNANTYTLKTMKISINYMKNSTDANIFVEMWQQEWGNKARVKVIDQQMYFSVED